MMRSIILLQFIVFSWSLAFASDGEDSVVHEYIKEGQRQYDELLKFNRQNTKEGRSKDNLYIFSLDKNEDFLKQWVAYHSMSATEKDEYSSAFLEELNTYLGEVNADKTVKFQVYVCLVSNFKVKLKVAVDDDLNQQEKVLASLKEAYKKSKSSQDGLSLKNYAAYREKSRIAVTNLINTSFKNRDPNHIILSAISYYQFKLGSNDKLVSYRRGSYFVRVEGMPQERKDALLASITTQGTDFQYTMNPASNAERDVEQKVKKVENFLRTPHDPTVTPPAAIDITALDESTKEERDAHWARDVQALADDINANSILANVNNYVLNISLAATLGLDKDISVFHHKFKVLDYETQIKFIVAFVAVDYTIPEYKKNQFTQEVLQKLNLGGNKVVLITVPVYSFADENNEAQAVTSLGRASTPADLIDAQFQNAVDPREFIINAYKRVPKPYTAHVYMVSVTHSVAYAKKTSNGPVRGFASIYDVLIYKSKYLDQLEDLYVPQCETGGCGFNSLYIAELEKYYKERLRLVTEGVAQEAANPAGNFRELDSDKWNTKRLKEDVIEQKHLAYFKFAIKGELGQWFEHLGVLMGVTELTELDFYTFNQWNVIDPIVYGALDIAGFIPVIENFADAAGLIYASVRGDLVQVENYTLGLVIVGAGALTVKAVRYIVAIRKADNSVGFVAKNVSELAENEARDIVTIIPANLDDSKVSEIIHTVEDRVKVGNKFPTITWTDAIKKKFIDAGLIENARIYEFQQLLSRSDLTPEAADGLIRVVKSVTDADFVKASAKIRNLGESGVKFLEDVQLGLGETLDWTKWDDRLVDAWKALDDGKVNAALRRDTEILEGVRDYCN